MRRILCNQRGIALILTITIISLLVVMTVQFGLGMRREYLSSMDLKEGVTARGIAVSGINIAMEILDWDAKTTGSDSFQDVWSKTSDQDFSSLFDYGDLHLVISDLSGRLQINSLVPGKRGRERVDAKTAGKTRKILKRLLVFGKFGRIDQEKAQEIVDSLVDWIDADDQESPFGAEDAYYQSLSPAYGCKNGPVAFVQELLLVKGMSRSILYGTKDHRGLASYITAFGNDAKININTADPILLQAMDPAMTEESAAAMVRFRKDVENKRRLLSPVWYKEIPEWPFGLKLDPDLVTTGSRYFFITSMGRSGSLMKKEEAWVKRRRDKSIVLLSTRVE